MFLYLFVCLFSKTLISCVALLVQYLVLCLQRSLSLAVFCLFSLFGPFIDCTCLYSVAAAKPPLVNSLMQCYWGEYCFCDVPPSCRWHWLCSHAGCKWMNCLMNESQNTNWTWLILRNTSLDELCFCLLKVFSLGGGDSGPTSGSECEPNAA